MDKTGGGWVEWARGSTFGDSALDCSFFWAIGLLPPLKKKVNVEREVICYSINLDICISKFVVIRCVTSDTRLVFYRTERILWCHVLCG